MSLLARVLGRLIRIGRKPTMLPSEARYVVLTNIVALLGVLFSLGFGPVLLIAGTWLYPAIQIGYALLYLPTLWLNGRGHPRVATAWLLLGSQLMVVSMVLVQGNGYDVSLFFMLHAVLPFLLFPPRYERAMFALAALAAVDLVLVVAFGDRLPQLGPPIAQSRLAILRPVLIGGLFATIAACGHYARRATLIAEAALDRAHERSEELLLNILPPSIAGRLKQNRGTIADGFTDVTVLFADIVGFTTLSSKMPPGEVVDMLNDLFCTFDDLAGKLGLEKIKTIGDCYMVAGGLPEPRADHADAVAEMGLGMLRVVAEFAARAGHALDVRVGIHSGPVVAGVIGRRKFVYDLWGDTVNVASRMESHGLPGAVQVSEPSQRLLEARFVLRKRGTVDVKGKGAMETWILEARREAPSS